MKVAMSILVLSFAVCLSAQDYIHTVDTKPIAAKVTEIGDDYVLYKTFDNQDGPNYKMPSWRVVKIILENGTEHIFPKTTPFPSQRFGAYPYHAVPPRHGDHCCLEYHNGQYYYKQERLRQEEIEDYIGYSLYGTEYMSAKRKYYWGKALTFVGSLAMVSGITMHIFTASTNKEFRNSPAYQHSALADDMHNSEQAGLAVCYIVGAGGLGAGIPLWVKGQRGLRKIADDYNRTYGNGSGEYSLNLGTTASGFGFSLNF